MTIHSMTGFGRGEVSRGGLKVIVELSSVNRRQFDCGISLPRELSSLEAKLHAMVHREVRRGHVKGIVHVSHAGHASAQSVRFDLDLARAQVDALRDAARRLGLSDDTLDVRDLLRMSDVLVLDTHPDDPLTIWPQIEQAAGEALKRLITMRSKEGRALGRDLKRRFAHLRRLLGVVLRRAPESVAMHRRNLLKRIEQAGVSIASDDPSLLRDLVLYADRCDITEECTRLQSHLAQADAIMTESSGPRGRTLDFLCQELFREINTVGSKANDCRIAQTVVSFKAELEAIREQVQNIE